MIRPVEEIIALKLVSVEDKVYFLLHGFGFHIA